MFVGIAQPLQIRCFIPPLFFLLRGEFEPKDIETLSKLLDALMLFGGRLFELLLLLGR